MIKNFFKTICLGLTCITCALGASACNPSDSGGKQGKMTEEEWKQAFESTYNSPYITSNTEMSVDNGMGIDKGMYKINTVNGAYYYTDMDDYESYKLCYDNFSAKNKYGIILCSYRNSDTSAPDIDKLFPATQKEYEQYFDGLVDSYDGRVSFYDEALFSYGGAQAIACGAYFDKHIRDSYQSFEYDAQNDCYVHTGTFEAFKVSITVSFTISFKEGKLSAFHYRGETSEYTQWCNSVITYEQVNIELPDSLKNVIDELRAEN